MRIRNWSTFQHYKLRRPAWIKLHKSLLDDMEFLCLPVASRALAPMLWLLASEYPGGDITAPLNKVAFRLRMSEKDLVNVLKPLVEAGFIIIDASSVLAQCYQDATTEKSKAVRVEKRTDKFKSLNLSPPNHAEFDRWYASYPRKVGKAAARKAFDQARKQASLDVLIAGLDRYLRNKPPKQDWCHPATWLNQGRWDDQELGKPTDQPMTAEDRDWLDALERKKQGGLQ